MKYYALILGFLFLNIQLVTAQNNDETLINLANQIAERRSQVEVLSARLDLIKTENNEELRSLASQKADLETQIKREEIRLQQVDRDMEQYRTRLEDNRASMAEVEPLVRNLLLGLKEYIAWGIPFQAPQRTAEVEKLLEMLEDGRVDSSSILSRTWNMVESEFRLAAENGLYRQTIELNGEEQLAEVARLGMVMLFFHGFDDDYGYAVRTPDGWEYRRLEDRKSKEQLAVLFESFTKNLREGYFELPNPRAEEE